MAAAEMTREERPNSTDTTTNNRLPQSCWSRLKPQVSP